MPSHMKAEEFIADLEKSEEGPEASTLLTMLVAGLVLIVVGAVIVMTFV